MKTHPAFRRTEHRPWPIPPRRWIGRQSWCDLMFAHWPVAASALTPLVPDGLDIQEFDGTSWVGVVPFRMEGVMLRGLPDMPYVSAFPELNLRLYVEYQGRPGVWFLSLDATNLLAVHAARRFYHLPYQHASITCQALGQRIVYRSARYTTGTPVRFAADYEPVGQPYEAVPGTLEHWLTERYCLYAESPRGNLYRAEVHHVPWPLQKVTAEITLNELATPFGFELQGPPHLTHFARRVDVAVWPLERLR